MGFETNAYLQEALEHICKLKRLSRWVIENQFHCARKCLTRDGLWSTIESNFTDPNAL